MPDSPVTPFTTLQASITDKLITMGSLYNTYTSTSRINQPQTTSDTSDYQGQIAQLNLQIQDLERQQNVYDREFLDRTRNPSKPGMFSRLGLRTTEDWVLAFFFLSYILFFTMILITGLIYSQQKMFYSSVVVGSGLLFGFLILLLIYRYA
jgi:hypothetical protein